jgi:hypothetical protein
MPGKKKSSPKKAAKVKAAQEQDLDNLIDHMTPTIEGRYKELHSRSEPKYDGVLGTPPAWMFSNAHAEFEKTRNRVLRLGYDPDSVQSWIQEEIATQEAAFANEKNPQYVRPSIPLEIRKDINTLALVWQAKQLGPDKGLGLLTDNTLAGQVAKGKKYGMHQSRIAKLPRSKVGDDKKSISQIISRLGDEEGLERETAKELWDPFYNSLRERRLDPKWIDHPTDPKKNKIEYNVKDSRKSITFGQFENVLSQYRKKKSG